MKAKPAYPSLNRFLTVLTMVAWVCSVTAIPGAEETDTVSLSAGEFQRLVYSADLLTRLVEKPELDAALKVLLELQRRNPGAEPNALAGLSRQALEHYRSHEPSYLGVRGSADEVLAAYLDSWRQLPDRTNFIPANLSLLHSLLTRAPAPRDQPQAGLVQSGNQRLLNGAGLREQQRQLVETCVLRAERSLHFRVALEALLLPETLVSVNDSARAVIANTNSLLHGNPTFQTLLALHAASGDTSVTVSSNLLITLFNGQTQSLWDTIHSNLALRVQFNQAQPELLSYLTNTSAIVDWETREASVRLEQVSQIASATAAFFVQSALSEAAPPTARFPEGFREVGDGLCALANVGGLVTGDLGEAVSGLWNLFNLLTGQESTEDHVLREVSNIRTMLDDLSTNVNYRFDRVDQSLTQIFQTLNEQFSRLNLGVDAIRLALLEMQSDLSRIERNVATFHALDWRFALLEDMNLALGYEARVGLPMTYVPTYVDMENSFYTHAHDRSWSETLSRYTTLPFNDSAIYFQLSPAGGTNVYAETLNYLKKCLRLRINLGSSFPEQPILANPQDWSAGASAWLQLAAENPEYFRRFERGNENPDRLDGILSKGRELTNFFRALTFTGNSVNTSLYQALGGFYLEKWTSYTNQVRAMEQRYASDHGRFVIQTWRRWSAAAPRLLGSAGTARQTAGWDLPPMPPGYETNVVAVAAGQAHSLALKGDGTVEAWGRNPFGPTTNVPPDLSSVVAIAAGDFHSLALRADGTVVGWGENRKGECNTPARATNVVAVAAGSSFSLALKADGTIVGWGDGDWGQQNIPSSATNVVAIAAGNIHGLALRADGTVVGWGVNIFGETVVPAGLSNVVAVAAGYGHSLALRANGTVVAWGNNLYGETKVPPTLDHVVAIAAGDFHSLALREDGTVVGWGNNEWGQTAISATNVVAISGGGWHSMILTSTSSLTSPLDSPSFLVRAQIPRRVGALLRDLNGVLLTNLNFDLHDAAIELSSAKALFQAVLETGLPYTLEQDEVLHGFLYGSESLLDIESSRDFLNAENSRLAARSDARSQGMTDVGAVRFVRFKDRLNARLNDLALTGKPELPRMVEHTMRLLNLLRDAWSTTPPSTLEIGVAPNAVNLRLYGEPYAHYTLQYRDDWGASAWQDVLGATVQHEASLVLPTPGIHRYYRALLSTE